VIGFTTGINGMRVAQQMIDLIGANISNAATEGYHRQDAIIRPIELQSYQKVSLGGAQIETARRIINTFLEAEYTRQQTQMGTVEQELMLLETIEGLFGQLDSGSLPDAVNEFYQALDALAADPGSLPLRSKVVWAADALARELRNIALSIDQIAEQTVNQLEESVAEANNILQRIAGLNTRISTAALSGRSANALWDQRSQAINELAALADIQVSSSAARPEGVEISAWGKSFSLLVGCQASSLSVGRNDDGTIGIALGDSPTYDADISTGKIGALINMSNDVIPSLLDKLNALADGIIDAVNRVHVQGVGSAGGFESLTSKVLTDGTIAEFAPDATDGSFYVR